MCELSFQNEPGTGGNDYTMNREWNIFRTGKGKQMGLIVCSIFFVLVMLLPIGCSSMKAKESYNAGMGFLKDGKYVEAARQFYTSIRVKPDNVEAYTVLADTLMAIKAEGTGTEDYHKMIAEVKKIPLETARKIDIDDEIYSILINARKVAPQSELPNIGMGKFYLSKGQIIKAQEEFSEALKKNPNNATPIYLKALILVGEQKYDKAYDSFKEILKLDPSANVENATAVSIAYTSLIEIIGLKGKTDEESRQIIEKSISFNPEQSRGYSVLGLIAYKNGKLDEALKYFKTSLEKSAEQEAFVHKLMGKISEKKGNRREAIAHYKEFLKAYGSDGRDTISGKDEAVIKVFSGVDPDYRDLKSIRERVKKLEGEVR